METSPLESITQTFEFAGYPDVVSIETLTFEDLGNGRTRLRAHAVYPSMEARSKDSNYSNLLDATQIDKITAADEKIIPLIFGKSMDDAVKVKISSTAACATSISANAGTTILSETRPPRKLPTITETP